MAGATIYLQQQILNLLFRTLASYKPAGIWIALFTALPTDSGGGTEVSGGNYARQQVTQADANWTAPTSASPSVIDNVNAITWTDPVTWSGTVVGWGIYDASSAGNLLLWFDSTDKVVSSGDTVRFAAGALDVTHD